MIGAAKEMSRPVARDLGRGDYSELAARMPTRVIGPRAMSGDFRRFLTLTWMLAYLEFKLKFFGSVLGYAWQLMKPLMMFAVLYFVFTEVIRIGGGVPYYPVVLLSGIVLFGFFSESTVGAITSVVEREGLIRKISFPIVSVPISTVTSVFLTLMLNYLVVLSFALASGVTPTWRWIQIGPLLVLLYIVAASASLALSSLYVRFRDVKPIWEVIAQVLFYATPVIYTIEFVQEKSATLAQVMMCNPLATILQQMRHSAIDPASPSAVDALGGWLYLAIPMGIVVLMALFGFFSMRRLAPNLAEEL